MSLSPLSVALLLVGCSLWADGAALLPICAQGQTCFLPNCRCPNIGIPDNIPKQRTPQMVLLSIHGSLSEVGYQSTKFLLQDQMNPNGCPISTTLFISSTNTSFERVRDLYLQGTEIAIMGSFPQALTPQESDDNIAKSLSLIVQRAGIPKEAIRGWRDKAHMPLGELELGILQDHGFEYDSSVSVNSASSQPPHSGMFPFTLDHGWGTLCMDAYCLSAGQTGFWEVPLPLAQRDTFCAFSGTCPTLFPDSTAQYQALLHQFRRHYFIDRSPMVLDININWLSNPMIINALKVFIESTLKLGDVYFVNMHQAIEWVKQPTLLSDITTFEPWAYTCSLHKENQIFEKSPETYVALLSHSEQNISFVERTEHMLSSTIEETATMSNVNGAIEKTIMTRREQILKMYKTGHVTVFQKYLIFIVIGGVTGLFIFTAGVVFFCRNSEDSRRLRNKATHFSIYEFA